MSVLRVRTLFSPQLSYGYLLDVASIDMGTMLLAATPKPKRERALVTHADRMYRQWDRALWRRPKVSTKGVSGIRRPETLSEPTRCTLLVDAAFLEPFADAGISITADERRDALRELAASFDLDRQWADRVLQVIAGATKTQRQILDHGTKKQAAKLITAVGLTAMTGGALPLLLRPGKRPVRDAASDLSIVARRGGAALLGLNSAEASRELVRCMTHAVVVDAELCGDEGAIGDAPAALAEQRAELLETIDRLRATGCPKSEIREAETKQRSVDLAIDWLTTQ